MACEVRFGPIALLASGPQRGGERDYHRLRTITYHPDSPQVPLQTNGLVPVWLQKHVQARGRLVCILPQKGQGNLALWEVLVTGTVNGVVADAIVETVVEVGIEDRMLDCVCGGYIGTFHINGRV
jgi:hypothetical protein